MKFLFTLYVSLLLAPASFAQDTSTVYTRHNGTTYRHSDYVENMTNFIQVSPFVFISRNHFEIQDRRILTFEPNESANVGVRLQHKWIGFGISYGPKNLQSDKKGATQYLNLQFNSYGKKLGVDLYYTSYQGYYIENYKNFPSLDAAYKNVFPQRPDIVTNAAGANVYYVFNQKKYSYRSNFIQNERQKKSAGSFMLNASLAFFNLRGDSTIIPRELRQYYNPHSQLLRGDFYSFSLLPGYAHTFVVWQRFYLALNLNAGLMTQYQDYEAEDKTYAQGMVLLPRVLTKAAIGYSGEKYYAGISSLLDTYNAPLAEKARLTYVMGNVTLFVGVRIPVPNKLQKYSDMLGRYDPHLLIQKH